MMTKNEIMAMAYEAGIEEAYSVQHGQVLVQFKSDSLDRFAALVAAKASEKEREACADLCDWLNGEKRLTPAGCAAAIRTRGNSETK
jgi:hypothetical protein